jgi:ABC-2 type transport system ATP-binding protein
MLALIRQLQARRGCSIVLSSHLLPDVEAVCEQVIVLSSGRLIHAGPLASMRAEKKEYYEVRVKGDAPAFAETLRRAGCQAELVEGALRVRVGPGEDADAIFREAQATGIQVRHLARCKPSLEEAFLEVLQRGAAPSAAPSAGVGA